MAVKWSGPIELHDAHGAAHILDQPRDGALHAALHVIGESYSVRKAAAPLDWSLDGR